MIREKIVLNLEQFRLWGKSLKKLHYENVSLLGMWNSYKNFKRNTLLKFLEDVFNYIDIFKLQNKWSKELGVNLLSVKG